MTREITAAEWRIRPEPYNSWALCKPKFTKEGEPRLDEKGNPYYQPERWYTTLERALAAWTDMQRRDTARSSLYPTTDLPEYHAEPEPNPKR